jgi:iron complex transport system ATP-binding protein
VTAFGFAGVTFGYRQQPVIEGLSLDVAAGEFVGIIGPNGSGKSTLVRLAAGLLGPRAGTVEVFGRRTRQAGRRWLAQTCGVVLQESSFAFDYTVEDVVLMGRSPYLSLLDRPGPKDRAAAARALELVDCAGLGARGINSLSGGEKQRVLLARALAQEPKALLLDEALTHLDIGHQAAMLAALRALNARGVTLLLVSHDLNLAALACSRLVLLAAGRIVAAGAPEVVVTRENVRVAYGVEPVLATHPASGRPQLFLPAK